MLRLSKGGRIRGTIKASAKDFQVNEITRNGTVLEAGRSFLPEELGLESSDSGRFSLFVLQKENWNTTQALRAIAKIFKRGAKSTGFAGTKDRVSVSTQLCSIFGVMPDALLKAHVKDVAVNCAWRSAEGVRMGELLGNRFSIMVSGASDAGDPEGIDAELEGVFPNYFGEQRFGVRGNNADVGVRILKGDFKGAAMAFLSDATNETRQEAIDARRRIAEEQDFKDALGYFPGYLKYERLVIEHLARYPDNYANALRRLPRQLSLMFVHSVEADIFNKELEGRTAEGSTAPKEGDYACMRNFYGFPDVSRPKKLASSDNPSDYFALGNIVGYNSKGLTELETELLDEMDLTVDSFKARGMNELNSKGTFRVLFAPYKNLSVERMEGQALFGFSLPAGSYATTLMSEFVDRI